MQVAAERVAGVAFAADEVDRFVKKILGNLKFKLGIEIRE